ncbi:MAG TPA: DUF881 domain-containing protein [Micromonosporaceae bacterium]|nr:DUF881 domain-containing protein [Micromonosporaceae bacterium]
MAEPDPVSDPEAAPVAGRRLSAAGAVIGLLLVLLGFALVVQVRSNTTTDAQLTSARPEDLVRILSDLDSRQERLRQEIADLEDTRRQLASGAQGREAALAEAQRRADELGILAGTLPAVGPGLSIRLSAGEEPLRAVTVLDAVEELRGAGAEAMQISGVNGTVVRVVASTYFVDSADRLTVDDAELTSPFTIDVIGDPQTMQTALNIPGGVVDSLRQHGGTVAVHDSDAIGVTALHRSTGLRHARPVS